jgi:hypothetical protein
MIFYLSKFPSGIVGFLMYRLSVVAKQASQLFRFDFLTWRIL